MPGLLSLGARSKVTTQRRPRMLSGPLRKERTSNQEATKDWENLTDPGDIKDTFWKLCHTVHSKSLPRAKVTEWERSDNGIELPESETVYTDGGCINNGDDNAKASAGIWFGVDDERSVCRLISPWQAGETRAQATPYDGRILAESTLLTDQRGDALTIITPDISDGRMPSYREC
ncbi:hypothetical protein BDZ89DRAFT_16194 [Hymenopellis radicata]|nr:hypothetical protein BDZ89DRAFT_16194 [Hymenopellis radicata]